MECQPPGDGVTLQPDILELRDQAASRRTTGLVVLGIGGAVLIVGAVKLAIPPDAPRTTVQPTAGGAVVLVGGAF